jgi:hypothetical protein
MADQSHRTEMSAAIRAQRERNAVPRSFVPDPPAEPELPAEPEPPAPEPEEQPATRRRFLDRFRSSK